MQFGFEIRKVSKQVNNLVLTLLEFTRGHPFISINLFVSTRGRKVQFYPTERYIVKLQEFTPPQAYLSACTC
jgi:hypothetical protein